MSEVERGGACGDLRGGVSKYFNNEHVCRKKAPTNPTWGIRNTDLDQILIKRISQFSNTGWRTDNVFAGFHLACSRLSVVGASEKGGRARKKRGELSR